MLTRSAGATPHIFGANDDRRLSGRTGTSWGRFYGVYNAEKCPQVLKEFLFCQTDPWTKPPVEVLLLPVSASELSQPI